MQSFLSVFFLLLLTNSAFAFTTEQTCSIFRFVGEYVNPPSFNTAYGSADQLVLNLSRTDHYVRFRNMQGKVFRLPTLDTILAAPKDSEIRKAHEEAIGELFRLQDVGGFSWYAMRVSSEIRAWAKEQDANANLTRPYRLPDGEVITLSEASWNKLRIDWADRFRPAQL